MRTLVINMYYKLSYNYSCIETSIISYNTQKYII